MDLFTRLRMGASGELVEHGDGPLGSIKGRALPDSVGDYQFLKNKDSAPCCSTLFVDYNNFFMAVLYIILFMHIEGKVVS
jgi:hypothetical protein